MRPVKAGTDATMNTIGNKRYNLLVFLLFIIPAVMAIVYAFYIPFIMNIYYAFTQWNGIQKVPTFNGIDNFKEIFREDDRFAAASLFTLRYGIFYIALINALSLFLAILLDKNLVTRTPFAPLSTFPTS